MTQVPKLPERIARIVGTLPEGGKLHDPGAYPFETVRPAGDGFVERGGVRTYYAVWGQSGPVVVFAPIYQVVHTSTLKATVPYLSRYFRVVTIDLRGNGRSDRPSDPAAYTFDHYYADMLAVIDRLQLQRLAVVGVSASAMLAIRLAVEQPARVSHLITTGGEFEWFAPVSQEGAEREAAAIRDDFPAYLDGFFDWLFAEPHSTKQYEDGLLQGWATTGETLLMATRGWAGTSVRDLLPRVTAPALIIHGSRDRMVSYESGLELRKLIAHSQMLTTGEGAHAPQVRDPVIFNHTVRDFVGGPAGERTWTRAMS